MKFFIKEFFSKESADLATFTEEILNRELYFLCGVSLKDFLHNLSLCNFVDSVFCFINLSHATLLWCFQGVSKETSGMKWIILHDAGRFPYPSPPPNKKNIRVFSEGIERDQWNELCYFFIIFMSFL